MRKIPLISISWLPLIVLLNSSGASAQNFDTLRASVSGSASPSQVLGHGPVINGGFEIRGNASDTYTGDGRDEFTYWHLDFSQYKNTVVLDSIAAATLTLTLTPNGGEQQ